MLPIHFVRKTKINTPKKIKQIDKKIRSLFYPIYALTFLSLTIYYGYIEFKKGVNIREAKAVAGQLQIDTSGAQGVQKFNKIVTGSTTSCSGEICTTGNVGIGTTAPGQKLDVAGNMALGNYIYANSSNTVGYFGLLTSGGAAQGLKVGGLAITSSYTNAYPTNGLYVQGNVGIGTTGPGYKLDVSGNIRSTGTVYANANGAAYFCGGDDACLYDINVANTVGIYGVQDSTVGSIKLGSSGGTISGYNGNVGIGTTSPGYPLDVAGAGRMRVRQGTNGTAGIWFYQSTPAANRAFVGMAADDKVGLWGNTGAGWGLVMDTTSGNVGIGTTAPGYKLQVAGSLYVSGSSKRFKENIKPLEVDSSKIYQLNPVSFDYKEKYKEFGKKIGGEHQIGLIAEEVYKVIPELAIYDSYEGGSISNVDYEKLPVIMLKEVQKHEEKIKRLEMENKALEERVKKLELLLEKQP